VGDLWHIVERSCPAFSDPHCWWCGDDSDTTFIPPGVDNWLMTPIVNTGTFKAVRLHFILHAEVPTVDDDYWMEEVTFDGGETWHHTGTYWADYPECNAWSFRAWFLGTDLSQYSSSGDDFAFRITFHTNDNGCGPGAAGAAGITLDDIWLVAEDTAVERASWSRIKAMYR
jgi:hypothetical protein